jgi:putative glycosyltransferase
MQTARPALSIVTTLYRSEATVAEFYARARAMATQIAGEDFEIVFVNDGTPDGSLALALGLYERDPRVRVIDLARNFGHHRAMMTGLAHARGELVFLIDSDLEEAPELLPQFHATLREGGGAVDVVYGVQRARKGSWVERVSGAVFFRVFNLLSPDPLPVNVMTVRLMTRRYVESLVAHQERETIIAGLWVLTGYGQVAVPVVKGSRPTSSYSLVGRVTNFVNAVTSFSDRPLVLIFYIGTLICAAASAAAFYLIVRKLFFDIHLAGYPSLIVSIWLLGGLTIFCVGLIGIYLSKVFIETKQRPYTIVRHHYDRAAQAHGRPAADA